jgi:hypothetical protein
MRRCRIQRLPRPGDDYLIALAVEAQADVIATGDLDLLELSNPPVTVDFRSGRSVRLPAAPGQIGLQHSACDLTIRVRQASQTVPVDRAMFNAAFAAPTTRPPSPSRHGALASVVISWRAAGFARRRRSGRTRSPAEPVHAPAASLLLAGRMKERSREARRSPKNAVPRFYDVSSRISPGSDRRCGGATNLGRLKRTFAMVSTLITAPHPTMTLPAMTPTVPDPESSVNDRTNADVRNGMHITVIRGCCLRHARPTWLRARA